MRNDEHMQKFIEATGPELKKLEPLLVEYLLTPNEPTNDVLRHIFAAGGKRVRPGLFLLISKLLQYGGEHRMPIAAVCEYIHTASLLHDDVIDNSTLRRGKPTANSIWGDETAVLAGDLIYSAACRLMVKTRSLELIDTFAECIRFMSESELYQLELLWRSDVTQLQYERVVHGKTAILFEASCKTPAFLAQLPASVCEDLGTFGKHLGFVFQIADDILDYVGDAAEVGKNVGADLLAGKATLPVLLGMHAENTLPEDQQKLTAGVRKVLSQGECTDQELQNLVSLVRTTGGVEAAQKVAEQHAQKARQALTRAVKELPILMTDQRDTLSLLLTLPEALLMRDR
jgi:octaprenyl-diphosphate synthase